MKNIVLTLIIALCLTAATRAQTDALPTLRGDEAVRQLKETGRYDSLIDAVKDARQENNQTESLEAVGQSAKLIAEDGAAGDDFGQSVAVSGDTVVVGAYRDNVGGNQGQGSAYVFIKNGTVWTQQAQLAAASGASLDAFGSGVAIEGETIVVGAGFADVNGNADQGSAYIFTRSGTVWTQQARLAASDGGAGDTFGYDVDISGNTIIVSAAGDTIGGNQSQGAAYIFVGSGAAWTEQAKLTAADGAAQDQFGYSVDISGDTALVGAGSDTVGANQAQGSAYIFVRNGTAWTQQAQLVAADGAALDFFGRAVALSNDTAVVGASNYRVNANRGQGAAYVFVRSGAAWTLQSRLTAADGEMSDQFGFSVAIEGDTIVAGANADDIGANSNQGSAYVFTRSGASWTQRQRLTADDGAASDIFGSSVSIGGNDIIVGAIGDDVGANANQGSAYAFRVLSGNWTQQAKATSADGAMNDSFGESVAISGDTAIIGAVLDDVGANVNQGSAYIFVRNGATWTQQTQLVAADGANHLFGYSVAISGDTAIVGAIGDNPDRLEPGAAYVFVRNAGVWSQQAKLSGADNEPYDRFGYSVSVSGDTAVVGSPLDDIGANENQGSVYIYVRSGTSWTQQTQIIAADGAAQDGFGYSAAISGNTVIIGVYGYDVGANTNQGAAFVYIRSGNVWTRQARLLAADGTSLDHFGSSVAVSGETIIVGAPGDDYGGEQDIDAAYIFTRSGTMWTQQQQLFASGGAANDNFGYSVAIDGDIAVIGAFQHNIGAKTDQGAAYVFERAGTSWTQKTELSDNTGAAYDHFGNSVAVSGDKIVVGSPLSDTTPFAGINSGGDGKTNAPAATNQGAAVFFVNTSLPATAANVSIGGRVLTAAGKGLANATLTLTDINGVARVTRTERGGNYRFDDVRAGETYVMTVKSRHYRFDSQIVTPNEDLTGLNFVAEP